MTFDDSRLPSACVHSTNMVLFLSALTSFGCVNLSKPADVEACAKTSTCSDEPGRAPAPEPGRDGAVLRDGPSTPDLSVADAADAAGDPPSTTSDSPIVTDVRSDTTSAPDTRSDSGGNDIAPAVEVGGRDQGVGDAPNASADLAPEAGAEPGTEAGAESGPEPGREPGPEPGPEPAPEPGRDGGSPDAGNCITQIISDGYAAGTAAPCSACNDGNGNSLATKCTGMLDCLVPPSTESDFTRCLNLVGGSSRVTDCVTALTTVACPTGY